MVNFMTDFDGHRLILHYECQSPLKLMTGSCIIGRSAGKWIMSEYVYYIIDL